MSTTYPTSLDSFTTIACGDSRNPKDVVNNLQDSVFALETKVGVTGSAVTTTVDYKLSGVTTGDKAVSLTGTETLTNKTFTDTTTTFQDGVDNTKKMKFEISGVSAGNTRVLTVPDADTTLVGTDTTQTLTNKTFTDSTTTFQDNVDTTKKLQFQVSGVSAGTTRTLTIPDANTTILGTDNVATVTNKTLSSGVILDSSADENMSFFGLSRQSIINGNMDIWQRNTTFTPNDDVYTADRWNFLTETNGAWTVARDTDVPSTKSRYSMKFTNVTLNNQCAIVQFIESENAKKLAGRTVSLSFAAKTSGTEIANLRATVLAWNSTADSVTSDVISAWASDGTDPTFAANWTKEIAGSNLALTSSWQTFLIENIVLDTASTNNYAVIIWVDDGTIAANDDFWITQVQMNVGVDCLPFQPLAWEHEYDSCLRFYEKSFAYATAPAQNAGSTGANLANQIVGASTAQGVISFVQFFKPMHKIPTVTLYNTNAANAEIRNNSTASDCSGSAASNISALTFRATATTPGGSALGNLLLFHWSADAEL